MVRSDWLAPDALVEMIEALAHLEVGTPDPMYDGPSVLVFRLI